MLEFTSREIACLDLLVNLIADKPNEYWGDTLKSIQNKIDNHSEQENNMPDNWVYEGSSI